MIIYDWLNHRLGTIINVVSVCYSLIIREEEETIYIASNEGEEWCEPTKNKRWSFYLREHFRRVTSIWMTNNIIVRIDNIQEMIRFWSIRMCVLCTRRLISNECDYEKGMNAINDVYNWSMKYRLELMSRIRCRYIGDSWSSICVCTLSMRRIMKKTCSFLWNEYRPTKIKKVPTHNEYYLFVHIQCRCFVISNLNV